MKGYFILVAVLLASFACKNTPALLASQKVQLAQPIVDLSSVFFSDAAKLQVHLGIDGVQFHYLLNEQSGIYQSPLKIEEDFHFQVFARHSDYLPSDTVKVQGFRVDQSIPFEVTRLMPEADERYPGNGSQSLLDKIKAPSSFRGKGWLGFYGDTVQIDLRLAEEIPEISCMLSFLVDQGSWIFPPAVIRLYASIDGNDFHLLESHNTVDSTAQESGFYFKTLAKGDLKGRYLRIEIEALQQIPDWHAGVGHPAWFFIDEILLTQ